MITVQKCSVLEAEWNPNFRSLLEEYSEESSIAGLPDPAPKMDQYRMIESSDTFHLFGAFDAGILVGFAALLIPVIPHYGVSIAVAESLFAAKSHRKRGVGLKLIRAAERHAKSSGCPAILFSAPSKGKLAEVLPKMKYRETNRVFMKELHHE